MNPTPDPQAEAVLDFWFGADAGEESVSDEKLDMWFRNGANYDERIVEAFGSLLDRAAAGAFDAWCETPRGRLALIVLTDQMPRHAHRGTARAFAADAKAREVCITGIRRDEDRLLSPIERVVFYLPLEHAEDLTTQERCTSLYRQLAAEVSEANRDVFENYTGYAVAHRDIVARFGHFPHRSETLGRPLSDEERAFLLEPGSSF